MREKLSYIMIVALLLTSNVLAQSKISGRLQEEMNLALVNRTAVRALVILKDGVDIKALNQHLYAQKASLEERAHTVISTLKLKADMTQPYLIEFLKQKPASEVIQYKQFWVANIIMVEAIPSVLMELSRRDDVASMDLDTILDWDRPVSSAPAPQYSPNSSEPGLRAIKAHLMWEIGYTGSGVIVMNIDTGVDGNHPALAARWRGNQPGVPSSTAWFEPSTASTFPFDSSVHGTHTMGTIAGLDPATNDTTGVAPGAHWIAASTFTASNYTSATIAAFQWAMDPDGNPFSTEDMPIAIGCSWTDGTGGSCATSAYNAVFRSVEAAGIAVVFSAGNNGPGSSSVPSPKNININLVNVFTTGSVDGNNPSFPIANSSSRGPSTCGKTGSLLIKPEVSAPGVRVRSCAPFTSYSYKSGTSMACPHVVGAIALLKEAHPTRTGYELKMALYQTAVDLGAPGEDNDYGRGIIDVYAAYLSLGDPAGPALPTNVSAYSDFLTPTEMIISWDDPESLANGTPITPSEFVIEIERNGIPRVSMPGGIENFNDMGLNDGQLYVYKLFSKLIVNDRKSTKVTVFWDAGGSMFPAPPDNLVAAGGATTVDLTWADPSTQSDATPLDDLDRIEVYRDGVFVANVPPGTQAYTHTPPLGISYDYTVVAVDNETPPNSSVPSNQASALAGTAPCPDNIFAECGGGSSWFGLRWDGANIACGQTVLLPCHSKLLQVEFDFYNRGLPNGGVPPMIQGDTISLALLDLDWNHYGTAQTIMPFDIGSGRVTFDFNNQDLVLQSGLYLFAAFTNVPRQCSMVFCPNQDPYPHGGRYSSDNGFAGPWQPSYASADIPFRVHLSSDEPKILSIADVPNDQGRQVRISWRRSAQDSSGTPHTITGYHIFRKIDTLPGRTESAVINAEWLDRVSYPPGSWDYVVTVPARGEQEYNTVVPTLYDSTVVHGQRYSVFFVSAATPDSLVYFDSTPYSGYSVDNLAPGVPESFVVIYNTGSGNYLSWSPCDDEDVQYFKVFRSIGPNSTNWELAQMTIDTDWNDDPKYDGWVVYYKITAVDFAGNESDPAYPAGQPIAVTESTIPKVAALYQNYPNPFNPTTVIAYDIPAGGGRATLTVFDVNGRSIRTLVNGEQTPGRKTVAWDGKDAKGNSVSSGVYFYRLKAGGKVLTKKMVLLK